MEQGGGQLFIYFWPISPAMQAVLDTGCWYRCHT